MRVVTWNSHHGGKGGDGKLSIERFGDALAALQPDVCCLQEIEQNDGYANTDQMERLRQRLGAVEAVGVHANGKLVTAGSSGISNAILSRWPIAGVQITGLPGNRAAIAGVVNGVTIVAAHLDNTTAQTRAAQVGTLMAWPILSRALLVLCGDWNAAPGAPELQPLVSTFEDAWFVASASKVATAFNGTGATKSRRIDAIFSRGLTITRAIVPDTRIAGVFPSDHHPLVVEFAWCPRPTHGGRVSTNDDNADLEPREPPDALTPTEASVMMLCAMFAGDVQAIETWTLLATTLEVPLEKIQAAGAIAALMQQWCQQYGPWDVTRPRRG